MKKYLIITLATIIALGSLEPRIEARQPRRNNLRAKQVCKKIRSGTDKAGNVLIPGGLLTVLIGAAKKSSLASGIGAGIFGAGLLLKLISRKKNKEACKEAQNSNGKG